MKYCDICIDDRHLYKCRRWKTDNSKTYIFEILVTYNIIDTTIIALDELVIKIRENINLAIILKMPAKLLWNEIEKKWQHRFLSSKYYLGYFKTIC